MQKISYSYRITVIVLAFLQNSMLAGLLFGWTSISGSLLISDTVHGGPGLSAQYVHGMFVVAAFFSCLGPLSMGISLDRWGPRTSSLISITLEGIGFALFGASNKDTFPMFIPAMCLIALGGPGILNATIHLSNLFPAWRATATACMTGSFQISFLVFLVFDELWIKYNLSYSVLFSGYCGVCLLNALVSLLVWPDVPFHANEVEAILVEAGETTPKSQRKKEFLSSLKLPDEFMYHPRLVRRSSSFSSFHTARSLEEGRRNRSSDDILIRTNSSHSNNSHYGSTTPFVASGSAQDATLHKNTTSRRRSASFELAKCLKSSEVDIREKPFYDQMTSPEFISLVLLFMVATFWANFYVGSFNIQLGDSQLVPSMEQQQSYCTLFTVVMTAGVVVIPVIGALMDWLGYTVTSALTIGFAIVWASLLLYPSTEALVMSFVLYTCFRTSFYAFAFAYIADSLGFKYFGALSGVMFVAGGLAGTLQYPLTLYAIGTCHQNIPQDSETCDHGRWTLVNVFMILTLVGCLSFTYFDWHRRKKSSGTATTSDSAAYVDSITGLKDVPLVKMPPIARRSIDRISPLNRLSLTTIRSEERISVVSFESADMAVTTQVHVQYDALNGSYTSIATDDSFFIEE